MTQLPPRLRISDRIKQALDQHGPVVALESTVITHGLPRPDNLQVARELEAVVAQAGATPATIALLDGQIRIGLHADELEWLALKADASKASLRDLGPLLAAGAAGGTTVAATLHIAHQAGIRVFATGGIGGVHRGHPEDVSADLPALSRLPLVVVCAGAKSILDLPRTLQQLETLGVPVIGVGTDELPAFYSVSSGLPLPARVDSAQQAAEVARAAWEAGSKAACLFALPLPAQHALDPEQLDQATARAQAEADAAGVTGRELTPYLLARVNELTDGASLRANRALLKNNAHFAAEIARALSTG